MSGPVVIVGAGHAGVQVAASLREAKYDGPVLLLCDEPHAPYQRPPLSKAYLKSSLGRDSLGLRAPSFYVQQSIATRFGDKAIAIDRGTRTITLASGRRETWDHLVLATGAQARRAPFPGADLKGVFTLRSLDDASQLKEALDAARQVVVVGAGFIGLEFAATATTAGKTVTVVEVAPRVMGRAVSEPTSHFFVDAHRAFGATILLGTGVGEIEGENNIVRRVHLSDGNVLPADLVLLGIGVVAADSLARNCGLDCDNGVIVDAKMRTSDPAISAIGDCCLHPNLFHDGLVRLESVQNANDQARVVARRLLGLESSYDALPWFWSDQGDLKLQIAGLIGNADTFVVRGDVQSRAFSVFAFAGLDLRSVESIGRAGEHMAARRIIGERIALTPQEAADLNFDLKALVKGKG